MRTALLLALAVMLATGCTRRQQDFAWFAVAVAAEVASAANTPAEQPVGVAVTASDPDTYAAPADLQRAHDVAMDLTRTAAHDARVDNCGAVVKASDQVRVIDPAVFANVFLRDPPIQRCIAIAPVLTTGVTVIE